jgi:hypothetical protein
MTKTINDNGVNREMTDSEQATHDLWAAQVATDEAAQAAAVEAKAAARASALTKLADLGLTDDEISALVG